MDGFEKRDVVEVAEELGIVLYAHLHTSKPYYTALCPLHGDTRPSFAIFTRTQKWFCWSCAPEGGDVIDLVQRVKNVSFKEALKIATTELAPEEAMVRKLASTDLKVVDTQFLQLRAATVFDRPRHLIFESAQRMLEMFDDLMSEGDYRGADKLLRSNGL